MDIAIDRNQLKKTNVNTDELIERIATGQAILFTGAGFSCLTTNLDKEEPSAAKSLAHDICSLGGFELDDDLRYATDYFLSKNNASDLISLLKRKYTITQTHGSHEEICKAKWRRFYTTNYDKSIEIASANVGKLVECIDVSYPTDTYYKKESLCIHLNGSIDSLNENSIETTFKLSTSSYISPDSFTKSDWHYYFKKDLERCSAIVFVGYSMYDIEVQKILFENSDLKDKTYFITRNNPDPKTVFTLEKFGTVIPIGVQGFADLLNQNADTINQYDSEYHLQSLAVYDLSHNKVEIRDADVEAMIMFGHINSASIDDAVLGEQIIPSLVVRDSLSIIKQFVSEGKNVVLYSDMGNGKSIISSQIHSYLTASSYECYYVSDIEADYITDVDHLSKLNKKIVITLDGYERYIDLLEHFSLSSPDNITIIATSRTAEHERLRHQLKEINFEYAEICLDELNTNEINHLIDIIDNLGMWGDNAGFSTHQKIKFISQKNNSQLSLTLLNLFNSPQFKERITTELTPLVRDKEVKDTIFAIALSEVLDLPCRNSLISDISGNHKIYSADLKHNKNFKNLFHMDGDGIKTKSSLFCLSLIRHHFTPSYVTETMLKIAKRFNDYRARDYEQRTIFLATLRFSFIERLLSDTNKKGNLKRYYESLKVSVGWLKNDPHFWLQYAMANITFKEYSKAQLFLKSSYSLARKRERYHTSDIDTQQARLFLLVAMEETEQHKIFDGFTKAHTLLDKLDNDVYKYRQVDIYSDFYNSCYEKLSDGNKVSFQRSCQKMERSIETAVQNGEINLSQQLSIKKTKDKLTYILKCISEASNAKAECQSS
ncbi:SIR2 family protein [Plesiomonas shigelloides]|uniref:SIR2 family protein n=1 Tax=Plesiomonas shigelloides TaxID=703 RepID=UPI0015B585D2|nr:SIR2 family protein [Plesiomonas shigelloides]